MDQYAPPTPAPAKKQDSSAGCIMLLVVVGGFILFAIIWTALGAGQHHSKTVSRYSYGSAWPLTVDSATIGCANGHDAYAKINGGRYALNGTAQSDGLMPIDLYWADEPDTPGLKVSLGALLDDALKLC